jgi:hypothetical protein
MIRILKNTTLFTIIFVFTLTILDLFIRYAGISQPLIYRYDSLHGRVFIENSEYTMTTEGFAMGTINDYGYIGPGYEEERTPGKLRISLLGDSYVEGFQHFDRNHFRAVMERELSEKYGLEAEVLNFGRFGYNLLNNYTLSKSLVERFNPDITFIFLSAEDIWDTTIASGLPRPYLNNNEIEIELSTVPRGRALLNRNFLSMVSPTVMMVRNCMTLIGKGETSSILFGKFSGLFNSSAPVQNENKDEIKPLSPIGKRILEMLAQKSGTVIVYRDHIPLPPEIEKSITGTGVTFISLPETLSRKDEYLFFIDKTGNKGHWNIKAHQLIGQYLAGRIPEINK